MFILEILEGLAVGVTFVWLAAWLLKIMLWIFLGAVIFMALGWMASVVRNCVEYARKNNL